MHGGAGSWASWRGGLVGGDRARVQDMPPAEVPFLGGFPTLVTLLVV